MTDKIQEIRKALEAATPGELHNFNGNIALTSDEIIGSRTVAMAYDNSFADIFANAPEWLSYLLTELDAAKQENERLKAEHIDYIRKMSKMLTEKNYEIANAKKQRNQAIEALEKVKQRVSIHSSDYARDVYVEANNALSLIREEAGKELIGRRASISTEQPSEAAAEGGIP